MKGKKVISLFLAVISLVCLLCGCGGSSSTLKTLGDVTGKTTLTELEKVTDGKFEEDPYPYNKGYYNLSQGATFFGLPVNKCVVGTRDDGTISYIEFVSLYVGSNKDIFDEMIVSLSKTYGNPDTFRTDNVLHYRWGMDQMPWEDDCKWLRIFDEGQCDAEIRYTEQ